MGEEIQSDTDAKQMPNFGCKDTDCQKDLKDIQPEVWDFGLNFG